MADNITYIPYGQDEISQQDLYTALANDLPNFVSQYKWLQKPKNQEKFLKAYDDIMKGFTGATNEGGRWKINTNTVIDTDSMSPKDKAIYEHAAYYIQQQMAKMTPRSKTEEAKKEDLTPFNFQESFGKQLLNLYGGSREIFEDSEQGWNSLDARGADGLRGTSKRKEEMAKQLEIYKRDLEGKDYNFEGTSFKDKQDALTKLQKAIDALRNTPNDESDDLPAFSALGLNYRNFFSNGGNEELILEDGRKTTYQEYNQAQKKKLADEAKAKAELAKQQRAKQYDGYKYYDLSKFNGRPLTAEESTIEHLNSIIAKGNWTGDEASQIVQAFKLAEKNGQLVPITDKNELSKFSSMWKNRTKQLRKINGIEGIYYDTVGRKFVKPYKNGQIPQTSFQDVLNQNSPEAIAKNKELAEQKKIQQANNRKLSDGFEAEDYLRMGAMAQDITGAVAAWVPYYGTAISGGLGLSSLATNFAADWNDDSVTVGDMFKNAGINLALAGVGMVPGLGLAAKSGKWLANIAKWTPRILTLASAGHIALSDNIKNSLKKASSISDWNKLTNQDVKNITYALSTVAGLSRGTKGFVNDRKFKPAFTENTEKQYTITTSKGKKTLTQKQVDEIKKLNPKDKEKYNEELKKTLGLAEDETISSKDLTAFGKTIKSKGIEIKEENVPVGLSSRAKAYRNYLENENNQAKENHQFLSKYLNTDYDIYKANTQRSAPNLAISDRIRNIWNPLSDRNLQRRGIVVNEEVPKTQTSQSTQTSVNQSVKITPEIRKNVQKAKKEMEQILNPTRSRKSLVFNDKGEATTEATINGEKINIVYNRNTKELSINGNKTKVKDEFDVRKQVLAEIQNRRATSRTQARQNKSENKFKINIEELKKLKKQGFLKQGGQINSSLDKIIEDFIKNNNI